ncbi:MAG: hypothetical protein ACREOD_01795 [Candidatus Dormibacteria bacterium]
MSRVLGQRTRKRLRYTGSLDAFLGLDVKVSTLGGSSTLDCNGGNALGTASCTPLYSPSSTGPQGLEVWVFGKPEYNPGNNYLTQDFGIGNDQTIEASGGSEYVDTTYSESDGPHCNAPNAEPQYFNCPVTNGFIEDLSVYVYWPLDAADDQNVFQNASATVTLTVHAVQAADNPLYYCPAMSDPVSDAPIYGGIFQPNQPENGWGAGLYAGPNNANSCPALEADPTTWTSTTSGSTLMPFFHPDTVLPSP